MARQHANSRVRESSNSIIQTTIFRIVASQQHGLRTLVLATATVYAPFFAEVRAADPLICDGFYIALRDQRMCLFRESGGDSPVTVRACPFTSGQTGTSSFHWSARMARDGAIFINPIGGDGLRLEVKDGTSVNGGAVQVWGANAFNWSNQQWFMFPAEGGGVTIRNHASQKCLAANSTDGFRPVQWSCDAPNIMWTVFPFLNSSPGCP